MKTGTGILAIALATDLLAACSGSDSNNSREKAMEDAAARHGIDADVSLNNKGEAEQMVINAGGSQVGRNLNLPAGFPDDIELPAAWDIIATGSPMPGSHSLQALSESSKEDIISDVRNRLMADGWTEMESDPSMPHMARISLEKGGRLASFNVIENGNTRAVQILIMPKP